MFDCHSCHCHHLIPNSSLLFWVIALSLPCLQVFMEERFVLLLSPLILQWTARSARKECWRHCCTALVATRGASLTTWSSFYYHITRTLDMRTEKIELVLDVPQRVSAVMESAAVLISLPFTTLIPLKLCSSPHVE